MPPLAFTPKRVALALVPLLFLILINFIFQSSLFSGALNWVSKEAGCNQSTHKCALLDSAVQSSSKTDDSLQTKSAAPLAPKFHQMAGKLGAWTTWAIFATIFFLVSLACLFLSFYFTSRLKFPVLSQLLAVLTLAAFIFLLLSPNQHLPVIQYLFPHTIGKDATNVLRWSIFFSSLGYAAAASLVLTNCFFLLAPVEIEPVMAKKTLRDRIAQTDFVLYFSVALLIASIVLIQSVYQWVTLYVVADPTAQEAADMFIKSMMTSTGGYYTLIAAGLYIPTTLILRLRLKQLESAVPAETETDGDQSSFVSQGAFKALFHILVILGPLLAGPIGELIGKLGGR